MTATLEPTRTDRLGQLATKLSKQSTAKRNDAYEAIDWDDPELAIGPDDDRVGLFHFDPLAQTAWVQAQPPEVRARIGLHRVCAAFKVGMQFENLLQRGLLSYAFRLPNGSRRYRYLHHEIIEESQHSLMFQELCNRSQMPVDGMPRWLRLVAPPAVTLINHLTPELFFVLVLGGEDPVDYLQRRQLREGETHPLVEQIMRIHVTEEARHIAFARTYVKEKVPTLSRLRRHHLAVAVPIALAIMVPLMVDPSDELHRVHGVPREVLAEAKATPEAAVLRQESAAKIRRLCRELGLMTPAARRVWKATGLWAPDGATAPS